MLLILPIPKQKGLRISQFNVLCMLGVKNIASLNIVPFSKKGLNLNDNILFY